MQRQAKVWLAILGGSLVLLWLLSNILLPFVLGMAIAYLLDPVADRLQRLGLSRTFSAVIIIVGFFILATLGLVLLLPTVIEQVVGLVSRLPQYFSALFDLGRSLWERTMSMLDPAQVNQLKTPFASAVQRLTELLAGFLNGVFDQSLRIVNVLTLLSVTPLVAFYLLRDWPTRRAPFIRGPSMAGCRSSTRRRSASRRVRSTWCLQATCVASRRCVSRWARSTRSR